MIIYIICPVRNITQEQLAEINDYVYDLEGRGHRVYYPIRDCDQSDETGMIICHTHLIAMKRADRVDILWDVESMGSHFDLGMAFALNKKFFPVKKFHDDSTGKSYWKVINAIHDSSFPT